MDDRGARAVPAAIGTVSRLAIFFICVLLVQFYSRAFQAVIPAGNPDEPAHVVTGLMVHDYLVSGFHRSPMQFARDYYVHYPKVALGHWPPVFYLAQAIWMLVFPARHASLLVLMALLTAVVAAATFAFIAAEYGSLAAWCACLLMLTTPALAASSTQVMTEVPQMVLILGAMLSFGKFLDTRSWRFAAMFGLWSAVSLLTKGTGIALAGIPVFSVLLTRNWRLLQNWVFWIPLPIVLLLSGPWYLFAPFALHERTDAYGGPGIAARRLGLPPGIWAEEFGWIMGVLVLVGVLTTALARGGPRKGVRISATALVISATLFPFLFYAWELRHQAEAAPAFIAVAVAGAAWIASFEPWRGWPQSYKALGLIVGSLALGGWNVAHMNRQKPSEYRVLAHEIVQGPDRAILIAGNSVSEGSLISEIAQAEPRPGHYVLRASKILSEQDWMGAHQRDRFPNAAEMGSFLEGLPLDLLVVDDDGPPPFPYFGVLERVLSANPEVWRPLKVGAPGSMLRLYRRRNPPSLSADERERELAAIGGPPAP
jgi:hypothetical protein